MTLGAQECGELGFKVHTKKFGVMGKLGLDFNNAHVGRGGLYHYHGIARSLTRTSGSSLVGYAGSYNEDYEYVGGENRLDQCNGGNIRGDYAYFIKDSYPFVPRCLYGDISSHFNRNRQR